MGPKTKTTLDPTGTPTDTSSTTSQPVASAPLPPNKHNRPCDQCRIKRVFCDKNINGCRPCEKKKFVCTYKLEHRKRGPKSKFDATLDGALKACGLGTDTDSIFKTISIMPQPRKLNPQHINAYPLPSSSFYPNPRSNIPLEYPPYLNQNMGSVSAFPAYSVAQPSYNTIPISYDQPPTTHIESNIIPPIPNQPQNTMNNPFFVPSQYLSSHKLNSTQAPYSYPIYNTTYLPNSHHMPSHGQQSSYLANQIPVTQPTSVSAPAGMNLMYPYIQQPAPTSMLNYPEKPLAHLRPIGTNDQSIYGDNFSRSYSHYKTSEPMITSQPVLPPLHSIQSSPIYHQNNQYPLLEPSYHSSTDHQTNNQQQFPYSLSYEPGSNASNH